MVPPGEPGTGAAAQKGSARAEEREGVGADVAQPAKKARAETQSAKRPRGEEKEDGEDRDEEDEGEDEEGGGQAVDFLGDYAFTAEVFQKARYSDRLFTAVMSPDEKAAALRGLTVKPENAPHLVLPDLDSDPLAPDLAKGKVGDITLKVKDIAPMFKSLAKVDQRMALLILNMLQLIGEIDPDNVQQTRGLLATANHIMERLAEVAAVGRSEKAQFKAAVFMHAKQRHIPLNGAIKLLNRKEQASVFTEGHVKDAMVAVANFNDAITDIGGSFRGDKKGNFRGHPGSRPYVDQATFREHRGRFQDPQQPQQPAPPRGRGFRGGRTRPRGTYRGNRGRGRGGN